MVNCASIGAFYGRQEREICRSVAATRYGECLRAGGVHGTRTPPYPGWPRRRNQLTARPIFVRTLKIGNASTGATDIRISFYRTAKSDDGACQILARLESAYFAGSIKTAGEDEVQALQNVLGPIVSYLQRKEDETGLRIWWLSPGDLEFSDFWRYVP